MNTIEDGARAAMREIAGTVTDAPALRLDPARLQLPQPAKARKTDEHALRTLPSARGPAVRRRFARLPQPPRRDRRGRRWAGWLAPLAAAVAMTVVVAVLVVTRGGPSGTGSAPAPASGGPDIYVTVTARYLQPLQASSGRRIVSIDEATVGTATIHDASTGAALTSVQLWPHQPEQPRGPAVGGPLIPVAIAAAADDRTFAIGDSSGLYLLHVAASGRAALLVKLSMTLPGGNAPIDFDLSPDGAKLAVHVSVCPGACVDGIAIITLATGAARTWLASSDADGAMNPSWTDSGKAVMFQWSTGHGAMFGYRTLSDAAPPGSLTAKSVPLPYPPAQPPAARTYPTEQVERPAVLTPDGRNLLIVTQKIVPASRNSGTIIYRITDVAPRTGRLLRVLRVFQTPYQGNPYASDTTCNIVSLAPAGLHALVQCPQFGRLDGSRFTPLPTGTPGLPNAPVLGVAW